MLVRLHVVALILSMPLLLLGGCNTKNERSNPEHATYMIEGESIALQVGRKAADDFRRPPVW